MNVRVDEMKVRKIARLARLTLNDRETAEFAIQLTTVLQYMNQINGLDVDGIEPFSHDNFSRGESRADLPRDGLTHRQALANAPDAIDGGFRVPETLPQIQ